MAVCDADGMILAIHNIIVDIYRFERFFVCLRDPEDRQWAFLCGTSGPVPESGEAEGSPVAIDPGQGILARAANLGQAQYSTRIEEDIPAAAWTDRFRRDLTAVCAIPLIVRTRVIGVLVAGTCQTGGIPVAGQEMLQRLGLPLALAIENVRLHGQLCDQQAKWQQARLRHDRAEKMRAIGYRTARLVHEIKNPMTAISTFFQTLPAKWHDAQYRNEFYPLAQKEVLRINALLDEMLDFGRTSAKHVVLVDIRELIEHLIALVRPQAEARAATITRSIRLTSAHLYIDREKIHQALLNILVNAVQAVSRAGVIHVALENGRTPYGQPTVQIDISDNGPGIATDLRDRVFEPYFSVKPRPDAQAGTGLGLAIVRQHIHDHGGTVGLVENQGPGANFRVVLPIERRKPAV